jgi:Mrp family chromosome partitioning ATPase
VSRNFEILQRIQQDVELFRVLSVKDIPENGAGNGMARLLDQDGFKSEQILRLVQHLFLATANGNAESDPRRVVFCGVDKAEGSSLVCGQVARRLAEQVRSQVCVVDANLRSPVSSPIFDSLEPDDSLQWKHLNTRSACRRVAHNLWFAVGDSLDSGLIPSMDRLRDLITDLRDEFRVLIINAPPVGLYGDAALLGQNADGVVLVLEANSTRRVAARKAKLALEAGNVKVLGTVLNNRTFPIPEKLYRIL